MINDAHMSIVNIMSNINLESCSDDQLQIVYGLCQIILSHSSKGELFNKYHNEWLTAEQQIISELERRYILS